MNMLEDTNLQLMRTSMTYGAETKTLTTQAKNKLAAAQRNKDGKEYIKHHTPGQKTNTWVREKTKVADVIE